ncbi:hypothetical protein [Salinisphaera sp. C84B14]|uniref:hypothetical protein n=1 Tax=Salinisphaera sp. C84B14 TaxID=1304155 RepID=UPI0033403DF6
MTGVNDGRLHGHLWWSVMAVLYTGFSGAAAVYSTACFVGSGCGYAAVAVLPIGFVLTAITLGIGVVVIRAATRRYHAGLRVSGMLIIAITLLLPLSMVAWIMR